MSLLHAWKGADGVMVPSNVKAVPKAVAVSSQLFRFVHLYAPPVTLCEVEVRDGATLECDGHLRIIKPKDVVRCVTSVECPCCYMLRRGIGLQIGIPAVKYFNFWSGVAHDFGPDCSADRPNPPPPPYTAQDGPK